MSIKIINGLFIFILLFSYINAEEIIVWQAFNSNIHNTNSDVTTQPFTLQGKAVCSEKITKIEAVLFQYDEEKRILPLDLYSKNENEIIFQGNIQLNSDETKLEIRVSRGGSFFSKVLQLCEFKFITNEEFSNYGHIKTKKIHKDAVNCLVFTRNNRYLISAADDNHVYILDPKSLKVIHKLRGHHGYVNALAITRDDKYVFSGGADGTIRVWEIATGKKIKTIKAHKDAVNALAISHNGKLLVSCSTNEKVALWDVSAYTKIRTISSSSTKAYISATFSSDDRYILTGDNGKRTSIFETATGSSFDGVSCGGSVTGVHMTRNMQNIFSGDATGVVKWSRILLKPHVDDPEWTHDDDNFLLNAQSRQDVIALNFGSPIVFIGGSGDGKYVMSLAREGRAKISEVETGIKRASATLNREASSGGISYDGKLSAIGELNGKINVYGLP